MSSEYQLAQINVARMVAPIDSPRLAGFVARLGENNALADRSPGFVWRLQSGSGDATSLRVFEDPLILVNMSVWQSVESLHDYVYRSSHRELLSDRKRWFQKFDGPYYALWWVERGRIPSVEEGKQKLQRLATQGPSEEVFWFGKPFPAPDSIASGRDDRATLER